MKLVFFAGWILVVGLEEQVITNNLAVVGRFVTLYIFEDIE